MSIESLSYLRPFSQGNAHESEEGMVRIYDNTSYPRIEIFARKEEWDSLDLIAQQVVEALNAGPDAEGP